MTGLSSHPLIRSLLDLDLPPNDYAVFGSGPLLPRGLHEPADLDIIARGRALQQARAYAEMFGGWKGEAPTFAQGLIEVHADWQPGSWDTDRLIDTADVFDGIPFVALEHVLRWKRLMGRPKDKAHCELILEFLARE